jgi:hypothetical protein
MPPGSELQVRARAPHSPAGLRPAGRSPSDWARLEVFVTLTVTDVNGTVTNNSRPSPHQSCFGLNVRFGD